MIRRMDTANNEVVAALKAIKDEISGLRRDIADSEVQRKQYAVEALAQQQQAIRGQRLGIIVLLPMILLLAWAFYKLWPLMTQPSR
jgi:hypothetical protein